MTDNLGLNLKLARTIAGRTQLDAAAKVGIGSTYLSNVECGLKRPSRALVERLAALYGIDAQELYPTPEALTSA